MKYAPKKVFVLENEKYLEITYEELCLREKNDDSYKNKLFLPMYGILMEVTKKDYSEYYQEERRQKYISECAKENAPIMRLIRMNLGVKIALSIPQQTL